MHFSFQNEYVKATRFKTGSKNDESVLYDQDFVSTVKRVKSAVKRCITDWLSAPKENATDPMLGGEMVTQNVRPE